MRSRIRDVMLSAPEVGEFSAEIRRIFAEIEGDRSALLEAECYPTIDVYETDVGFQITVDLPAVDPEAVQVVAMEMAVLVAGEKHPRRGGEEGNFHLVERAFGRFARLVRLTAACDPGRALATLKNGELSVSLPKVSDRRGRPIRISIQNDRA